MSDLLLTPAGTLPVWRDAALATLATIVIGALWLYATLMGVE